MVVVLPRGFRAAGVSAGLKSSGQPDLALVVNSGHSPQCAVVFTSNRAQAHPVRWSRQALKQRRDIRAVLLNSGGANCFTGDYGYETVELSAAGVAERLASAQMDVASNQVLVCSTGLIGSGGERFRSGIINALPELVSKLSESDVSAPLAILTTDSRPKTAVHYGEGWSIGAMAKGAGMLAPGLATMLVVLTTDVRAEFGFFDRALQSAVDETFNRLDSDGCMSTNDQVTLMASGESEALPSEAEFSAALRSVCQSLTEQLQSDAEGARHDIDIEVCGAASVEDAVEVGRAVARNNLFKAAIYGNDPNWGRVLAAIGVTRADFDPYRVDVSFNGVRLCARGGADRPVEECDLAPRRTSVLIDLQSGDCAAIIRTNDLTAEYVHENSAYVS